jgi:uncharacterized protein with PQ loop repeat
MRQDTILPVIIFTVVFIVLALAVFFIIKAFKRRKKKTQEELASHPDAIPRGAVGENTYDGITYRYKHFRGTDKAPPYFTITIPCSTNGAFKITKESKFDRFFKRLGVCVEMTTHDPEFDDTFYIATDTIPFTRTCLERRENRKSIQAVFNLGFNLLKHDGKSIIITWQRFPRKQLMETATMETVVAQMATISKKLPEIRQPEQNDSSTWKSKRLLAFGIAIFSLISGIITMIIGLTNYKPLDPGSLFFNSLSYSLPLFVLFVWISLQLLKGRSTSHYELIAVFIIAFFGFPLAGFGYTAYSNGAWDKNMATVHDAQVVHKYYSRNKNSYTYYSVVNSWREDQVNEKIKVSKSFYNHLQPGSSVMAITTKPGRFGYEWIVSIE